jgi:transposase
MATRAEWADRVERWERSGLSIEAFAVRERIKPKQLGWWRWKLRSSPSAPLAPAPTLRLLPVRVVGEATRPAGSGVALEIALPNGRVVRVPPGFDPAMLEDVLSIASEVAPC